MNQIGKFSFDFQMQDETFARSLYSRWENFYALHIEPLADEVLIRYDHANEQIEIASLELDLGTIAETDWDKQFPLRLREKLEEVLSQCLFSTVARQTVTRVQKGENAFRLLCRFLLQGTLSWSARQQYSSLSKLLLAVLQSHAKELKQFLQTYGHYTGLQERWVQQLDEPGLEEGIRLLAPGESTFIISYIHLLTVKYKQLEKPLVRQSEHRLMVWKVVYAYLLTNRSSYFNKKSFVSQTITRLAAAYNTAYELLLEILTAALPEFTENGNPELFHLLHDLRKEREERSYDKALQHIDRFYQSLSAFLRKELNTAPDKRSREALLLILAQPDSCRVFLSYLNESEIRNLVPLVIPGESSFVIAYAYTLDSQKEGGALQGKAGGEYTKLKWQLIFTLLLDNKGASFNRIHFVYSVLKKMAAHYNLSVVALLQFFYTEIDRLKADAELKGLLLELFAREQTSGHPGQTASWIKSLKKGRKLAPKAREGLWKSLADSGSRRQILFSLGEEEHRRLVELLTESESPFILAYASGLDKQQQRSRLEGKAGNEFRQLKWLFIWTLLTENRPSALNRKHLVRGVLRKIAAHYNLTYSELLYFFYAGTKQTLFSHEINTVLQSLYYDEQQQLFSLGLHMQHTEALSRLLDAYYPADKKFILHLLTRLDSSLRKNRLLSVSRAVFLQKLWEIIYHELYTGNLQRKELVRIVLEKLAKHDALSFSEILQTLSTVRALPELVQVLQELSKEETRYQTSEMEPESEPPLDTIKEEGPTSRKRTPSKPYWQDPQPLEEGEPVFIDNAGLVLITPYLPRLFTMLNLMEEGRFKDTPAQIKALFLMHYLVFGTTECPEYQLTLNKLLVVFPAGTPVPYSMELTEKEKETTDGLLKAVLQHWEKLKNTSVAGLREAFLQREGKLTLSEKGYLLTIETKAYDMLLDTIPWGYNPVNFSWMEKIIEVKWR